MHLPGEGNLFTAKPEPLVDLLNGIHKHRVALPNFQRPWVWEPDMVRDLLVSVAYRYPAGSLLTMPVTTAGFALRPFEGSGDTLKDTPNLMVLDGQQRLTSLYQTLYRRDGVRVRGRTYHFYIDVPLLMSDADGSIDVGDPYFEQALFFVAEERNGRRVRYDGLQPRYELTTRDHELAVGALPLGCIFDGDGYLSAWKDDYLVSMSNNDMGRYRQLLGQWDRLVRPWIDRIRNYPFPVVELRENMPLSAICHIFEKVNSTGVPLDVFDLCTAILWAQGFHLNEAWAETRKVLASDLPMQPLSGTAFLQALSLLDSFDRKRMGQGSVAVGCRKQELMAMKAETVKKWWPVLVDGYREAAKFMTDQGILSERILPYSTMIIPLAATLAYLKFVKGTTQANAAWPRIARWYWCSVFSQRYSSQVETNAAQDFEQLVTWIEKNEPPAVVQAFAFRSDSLQEIASIRNAVYKGVLCLLAGKGAKDFSGAGKLTTSLFYDTRQDHHHIFPIEALKHLGIDDPRADAIVNKTLIGAAVNRSIGGRLPSGYVNLWRKKLGTATFDEIIESHAIDPDVLSSDRWQDFVHDRRERLRQLIHAACGGIVQPFGDSYKAPETGDENDQDV